MARRPHTLRYRVMYSTESVGRVGFTFGRRTVVWVPAGPLNNKTYVRVRCSCGEEAMVRINHIQTGESPSCGTTGCRPARARNGWRSSVGALRMEGNGDVAMASEPPLHQIAWLTRAGASLWDAIGGAHRIERPPDSAGRGRPAKRLTINGRTQTAVEWSTETGIPVKTLLLRVNRRWPRSRWLEPVRGRAPRVQSPAACPSNERPRTASPSDEGIASRGTSSTSSEQASPSTTSPAPTSTAIE